MFNNLVGGIFEKMVAGGTTIMNVLLQNDGTVEVDGDMLRITRARASTSTIDVTSAATLQFTTNYTAK